MSTRFRQWLDNQDARGGKYKYGPDDEQDPAAFHAEAREGGSIDNGQYDRNFRIIRRIPESWSGKRFVRNIRVWVEPLE